MSGKSQTLMQSILGPEKWVGFEFMETKREGYFRQRLEDEKSQGLRKIWEVVKRELSPRPLPDPRKPALVGGLDFTVRKGQDEHHPNPTAGS